MNPGYDGQDAAGVLSFAFWKNRGAATRVYPIESSGARGPVLEGMRLVFSGLLVVEKLSQRAWGSWGETA